ncbi:MAG: ribonuclease III [Kiritimatiellae bacterium]|nr:ribonuclease III [Kiritimatiellia bacterium]NLG01214.1 ribonuclease III [Lentisphaerota bacterium]
MACQNEAEPSLCGLEQKLGYVFSDRALLKTAVTAPSCRTDHPGAEVHDNQRLEFLGDAVFGLLCAQWLFARYAEADEGALTVRRSLLANGHALAGMARRLGLGDWLRLGRGDAAAGGRDNDNTLADAMEALFGAAWCDGGLSAVETVFNTVMAGCEDVPVDAGRDNPKGKLLEVAQRYAWPDSPVYELVGVCGPQHAPAYRVAARVHGGHRAFGEGRTKRAAEKAAAAALLQVLIENGVAIGS